MKEVIFPQAKSLQKDKVLIKCQSEAFVGGSFCLFKCIALQQYLTNNFSIPNTCLHLFLRGVKYTLNSLLSQMRILSWRSRSLLHTFLSQIVSRKSQLKIYTKKKGKDKEVFQTESLHSAMFHILKGVKETIKQSLQPESSNVFI